VLGAAFPLGATFTDPGGARTPLGAGPSLGATGLPRAGARRAPAGFSASHTYTAAGSYACSRVTDKDGGTGVDQATVTVQASPPPNQAPTANAGGPYGADATVAFNGGASSDPDNNLPPPRLELRRQRRLGHGETSRHCCVQAAGVTMARHW